MRYTLSTLLLLLLSALGVPHEPNHTFWAVGFYNMDNFFDTSKDADKDDVAYLPDGIKRWTGSRYRNKLERMAFSISQIAAKDVSHGLAVLGVCEVENRNVLEDLVFTPPLDAQQWSFVHYDSPDRRGLDVALLFQRNRFEVNCAVRIPFRISGKPNFRSRDQLLVTGRLDGEEVNFIVAHYPKRGTCAECTQSLRIAAAKLTSDIVNFLLKNDPNAKIIIMGDFNDNPNSYSIEGVLNAKRSIATTPIGGLFNASYQLYTDGARSVVYRRHWHLFDQQIVSQSLLQGNSKGSSKLYQATVFDAPFLVDKYTRGRPTPTVARGFSKHFPTYLVFINDSVKKRKRKVSKKRPAQKIVTKEWARDTTYLRYIFGQETEVMFPDS